MLGGAGGREEQDSRELYRTGGKASSGAPGLDSVLSEVDLRVAVGLAKAGVY